MKKPSTITITPAHLDKAIDLREQPGSICANCVVALASREAVEFPVTYAVRKLYDPDLVLAICSPEAGRAECMFDNHEYDRLRASLPLTFSVQWLDNPMEETAVRDAGLLG